MAPIDPNSSKTGLSPADLDLLPVSDSEAGCVSEAGVSGADGSAHPSDMPDSNFVSGDPASGLSGVVRGGYSMPLTERQRALLNDIVFNPELTTPALDRIGDYSRIPAHLRTELANKLIRVGEIYRDLISVQEVDFALRPEEINALVQELDQLSREVIDFYTEKRSLPIFAINDLVNMTHEVGRNRELSGDAYLFRFDFDVGVLNNLIDTTGNAADIYVPSIFDLLRDSLGAEFGGFPLSVARLPERTSYLVAGHGTPEFVNHVVTGTGGYSINVKDLLLQGQIDGRISADVDLSRFDAGATVHYTRLHLRDFVDGYAKEHRLESTDKVPRDAVVDYLLSEFRRTAAETVFLKVFPKEPVMVQGGMYIFNGSSLPLPDDPLHAALMGYVDRDAGFVSLGITLSGIQEPHPDASDWEREMVMELTFPNIPHDLGFMTRSREMHGGGVLERLEDLTRDIMARPETAAEHMGEFYQLISYIAMNDMHMGELGRRNFRFPIEVKWEHFYEEIGKLEAKFKGFGVDVKFGYFADIEIDNQSSYNRTYSERKTDRINELKQVIMTVSRDHGVPVVLSANGDQIRCAFGRVNGSNPDYVALLRDIQISVAKKFEEEPFQPAAKIETGRGMKKVPIWVNAVTGKYAEAMEIPVGEGWEPFLKTLTVTIAHAPLPDISTPEGVAVAEAQSGRGITEIDAVLKKQNGRYGKQGFGQIPAAEPASALSQLSHEMIRKLSGPMTTPIEEFDLEPMTTPIEDLSKYNRPMIFTPGRIRVRTELKDGIIAPDYTDPLPNPEPFTTPIDTELSRPIVSAVALEIGAQAVMSTLSTDLSMSMAATARANIGGPLGMVGVFLIQGAIDTDFKSPAHAVMGANRRAEQYMDSIDVMMRTMDCAGHMICTCPKDGYFCYPGDI